MKIKLKTLTPLHIGNGEELHSLDYVVHQNRFYRIGQGQFLTFLRPLGKEAANKFSEWVIEKAEIIENLKSKKEDERKGRNQEYGGKLKDFNQELSAINRQFNYLSFSESIGQKDSFLQYLRTNIPSVPILSEKMKQQVRGAIRTGDGKVYLPGTSLKGSIRTALMFHLLDSKHIPVGTVKDILVEALDKVKKDKSNARKTGDKFNVEKIKAGFAEKLEEEAFYCPMKNEHGVVKTGEEQYDLLKLLLVSDAYPDQQSVGVDNVDLYLVSKKKDRVTNKMLVVADRQSQAPSVEVIMDGRSIDCHLEFNIEFLLSAKKLLKNGEIKSKNVIHWIGIEAKVKKLFALDMASLTPENIEEKRVEVLSHILNCVKKFTDRQIQHDRQWLRTFYEHDTQRQYQSKMKEGFETTLNRPSATLFNLGYATGFQGTTDYLYFLEFCRPELKDIMEFFSIGDKPGAGKTRKPGEVYTANPDRFPKSKRLITRPQEIMPLGWLILEDGNDALVAVRETSSGKLEAIQPEKPSFPKGPIRQNLEVYAEIMHCGKPNKIKLWLSESDQPVIDIGYGLGFPAEKKGSFILVRISALKGKNAVQAVTFVRFV